MRDLDARLRQGPLRVQSVWVADRPASVARRALHKRRALALALGGVLALATAGAAAAVIAWPGKPVEVQRRASDPAPHVFAPEPLRFSDGSIAEPHGPATQLRIEESTPARVRVRVTGGARFEVTPNKARTFEVRSGDVTVRVLGTAFSVDPDAQRTRVSVEHGRVQVSWASGSAILIGGEVGTFPPPTTMTEPQAEPEPSDHATAATAAPAAPQSAEDLMLAADVARLGAHPEGAIAPLRKLIARYPKDKRAPVAAFTLGRVLFDDLARPAEAAAAFESAHRAWPSGPLAQDALVRAVQAWQAAKKPERARAAAQLCLRRFPDGAHVAAMREAAGEAR